MSTYGTVTAPTFDAWMTATLTSAFLTVVIDRSTDVAVTSLNRYKTKNYFIDDIGRDQVITIFANYVLISNLIDLTIFLPLYKTNACFLSLVWLWFMTFNVKPRARIMFFLSISILAYYILSLYNNFIYLFVPTSASE